ncbi:putative GST-like protein YibF [Roseovarius albus]|uniref:Putative GST-like protein YibF n=1 Tax=Roseovarius albus TaxID=1247867 RepID=A0A1X6Z3K7_9RHOB|nr:glutathione S-transferase [Roseovarius albus]SLN39285.1 putative GST-like protein YibF [Roseovarius albus]
MKLISAAASPFGRKVKVLLRETGLIDQVEVSNIVTSPVQTDSSAKSANPLGKIPVLLREDGPALYDSRVITRYLDVQSGAGLYPEARIWDVLTLEATADGISDAALSMVYEHRIRPPEMALDSWIEAQWEKVSRALKAINERWMSHLSGPLDMSHIAVGCALGYLDFRLSDRNWRKGNDALDDWYAVLSERDSMKATAPE